MHQVCKKYVSRNYIFSFFLILGESPKIESDKPWIFLKRGFVLSQGALAKALRVIESHMFALSTINPQDIEIIKRFVLYVGKNNSEEIQEKLKLLPSIKQAEIENFIDGLLEQWDKAEKPFQNDTFQFKHYQSLFINKWSLIFALLNLHI